MDGFWHASNNFWEKARAKQLSKELIDKTWKILISSLLTLSVSQAYVHLGCRQLMVNIRLLLNWLLPARLLSTSI